MPRPISPNQLQAALGLLGLEGAWSQLMTRKPRSREEAEQLLNAFKSGALKSAYQRLALEHHPDRGGSEERMKELSEAFNLLKALTVFRRPAPRPIPAVVQVFRMVFVPFDLGGSATAADASASNTVTVKMDFRWTKPV
jgi:hypothetical protein